MRGQEDGKCVPARIWLASEHTRNPAEKKKTSLEDQYINNYFTKEHKKHMKSCSTLQAIKEMQIKDTMRHRCLCLKMSKMEHRILPRGAVARVLLVAVKLLSS